ncbi:MAG: ribosome recycling factor [bacterium]
MIKDVYAQMEEKMQKSLEKTKHEFAGIRTGRASSALLSDIKVEYYGTHVPINQVANIAIPEARLIEIKPWDKAALGEIEKAILKSQLGINPNNDGKMLRLSIPSLTEERRKELVKMVKKMGEEAKVSMRNIRREANDALMKHKDKKEITEDDYFKAHEHAQKVTDQYIKKIDEVLEGKEKEIMEV